MHLSKCLYFCVQRKQKTTILNFRIHRRISMLRRFIAMLQLSRSQVHFGIQWIFFVCSVCSQRVLMMNHCRRHCISISFFQRIQNLAFIATSQRCWVIPAVLSILTLQQYALRLTSVFLSTSLTKTTKNKIRSNSVCEN